MDHCDAESESDCIKCEQKSDDHCWATCKPLNITSIDYRLFSEYYEISRCQKDRSSKLENFPGMCKRHGKELGITKMWNVLKRQDRDVILYMLASSKCRFSNFSNFLRNIEYTDSKRLLQLLFSPVGLYVRSEYFTYAIFQVLKDEFQVCEKGASSEEECINIMYEKYKSAQEGISYTFLIPFISELFDAISYIQNEEMQLVLYNLLGQKLWESMYIGSGLDMKTILPIFNRTWMQEWLNSAPENVISNTHFSKILSIVYTCAKMTWDKSPKGVVKPSITLEQVSSLSVNCPQKH